MFSTLSDLKTRPRESYGISGDSPEEKDLIPVVRIVNPDSNLDGEFKPGSIVYDPYRDSMRRTQIGDMDTFFVMNPLAIDYYYEEEWKPSLDMKTFLTLDEAKQAGFTSSYERKSAPGPYVNHSAKILVGVELNGDCDVVNPIAVPGGKTYGIAYMYAQKRNFDLAKKIINACKIKRKNLLELSFAIKLKVEQVTQGGKRKPYYMFDIENYYDSAFDSNIIIDNISDSKNNNLVDNEDSDPF